MFIFAHVGITLGAAVAVSGAINNWPRTSKAGVSPGLESSSPHESFSERLGLKALSNFLDIRLLMLGSLFPDIIDKPLAYWGFGGGRSITHTLLVFMVILVTGYYLYLNHKKTWLLAIAIGVFSHLVLDAMWASPPTLFWPLYGWDFPRSANEPGLNQIRLWWKTLISDTAVDVTEAIGLIVLLGIGWVLIGKKGLKEFLLKGRI